jgi:hypothetical protein
VSRLPSDEYTGKSTQIGLQINLLMQNTLGSQDSPVNNTLGGSLDFLVYLSPECFFCEHVLMLVLNTPRSRLPAVLFIGELIISVLFTAGKLGLPGVFTAGSKDSPVYSSLGSCFGHSGYD